MTHAAVRIGNSSGGLLEAPSFALPAVNVGTRQQGLLRAADVIDVGPSRWEVQQGAARALDPEFRLSLRGMVSPCGDGMAAECILQRIQDALQRLDWVRKHFIDQPTVTGREARSDV
jgi:GDP/UDP-N,N'-diacetylbacillosamine 2-epimerase (hydrolysing)